MEKGNGDNAIQTCQAGTGSTQSDQGLVNDQTFIEECMMLFTETASSKTVNQSVSKQDNVHVPLTDLDIAPEGNNSDKARLQNVVEAFETEYSAKSFTRLNVVLPTEGTATPHTCVNRISTDEREHFLNTDWVNNVHVGVIKGEDLTQSIQHIGEVGLNLHKSEQEDNTIPFAEESSVKAEVKNCSVCHNHSIYDFAKQEISINNQDGCNKKQSKGNFFANMFKFSKNKSSCVTDSLPEINDVKENIKSNNTTDTNQLVIGSNGNDISYSCFDEKDILEQSLNSLYSGISVDKVLEHGVIPVEHANVEPNQFKTCIDQEADRPSSNIQANVRSEKDITNKEQYTHRDSHEKDFVHINERAIDVQFLERPIETISNENIFKRLHIQNKSDKDLKKTDEKMSNISRFSGMGIMEKASANTRNRNKFKTKRKSWSFQSGGKKKQCDGTENENSSMSADVSSLVCKKTKWRLGKFLFGRSNSEIYTSTPNLNNFEIPEESETINFAEEQVDRKKTKLKKVKEKKKNYRKTSDPLKLENRSASLLNFVQENNKAHRQRRSIVEDDINITLSDAFEGVSLSDLSLDGDEEVSICHTELEKQQIDGIKNQDEQQHMNQNFDENSNNDNCKLVTQVTNTLNQSAGTLQTHDVESRRSSDKVEARGSPDDVEARKSPELEDATYVVNANVSTSDDAKCTQMVKLINKSVFVENSAKSTNLLDQTNDNNVSDTLIPTETLTSDETHNAECKQKEAEILNTDDTIDFRFLPVSQNEWKQDMGENQLQIVDEISKSVTKKHSIYFEESFLSAETNQVTSKYDKEQDVLSEENNIANQIQNRVNNNGINYQSSENKHDLDITINLPVIQLESMNIDYNFEGCLIDKIVYNSDKTEDHRAITDNEQIQNITILKENVKPTIKPNVNEQSQTIATVNKEMFQVRPKNISRKVVIMKEVGVQAPDIYVPLDTKYFVSNKVACVSVGVQVTADELEADNSNINISRSTNNKPNHASAYF